jgi:bromodomain-containing protein 8
MSELSNVEALLLAQAVWELGSNAWPAVTKLLSKHPLIKRPKAFFAPNTCQVMYSHLMQDAQLQTFSDAARAPENLQLAQIFYQRRLEELRSLIAAEESKFK